jgi:O-antigen ligase
MTWLRASKLIGPAYLLACLLLGGSIQLPWLTAILQVSGIAIIAWAAIVGPARPLPRRAVQLGFFAAALVALLALQLLPVPFSVWSSLTGRSMVVDGFKVLGLAPGWQTGSLAPYDTISAGLALVPPFAVLALVIVLEAYTARAMALALFTGSLLSIALGVLQVASGPGGARFYLQPEFNEGTASGFFANPNHLATLLLISIPFAFAATSAMLAVTKGAARRHAVQIFSAGAVILLFGGLLMNRSLAGLGLLIPVAIASLFMVGKPPRWARLSGIAFAGAALALFAWGELAGGENRIMRSKAESFTTRHEFARVGLETAREYFPWGSGIGTFQRVYGMHERVSDIDPSVFVNHAHDDYLEVLIETGVPGMTLILLFLLWWSLAVGDLRRAVVADRYAAAGAIASAAVLLHSFVDYPLRTSAISASFALALALLAMARAAARTDEDLRETRHVEIV